MIVWYAAPLRYGASLTIEYLNSTTYQKHPPCSPEESDTFYEMCICLSSQFSPLLIVFVPFISIFDAFGVLVDSSAECIVAITEIEANQEEVINCVPHQQ